MDNIRCYLCGRFIGNKDFEANKVDVKFTPDTEFTSEDIKHYHSECMCKISQNSKNKKI